MKSMIIIFQNFHCIMISVNHLIRLLVIVFFFGKFILSFERAPGTFTLKILTPQYQDFCNDVVCKYNLEVCIGSGRIENERCIWADDKQKDKVLDKSLQYLSEISFDVDNVRATFYFNGNITYVEDEKILKTDSIKDSVFRYSNTPQSFYTLDFTTIIFETQITCKPGFYPKDKCSIYCFPKPNVHKCDKSGNKLCLRGHVYDSSSKECIVDSCSKESILCKNNGTCISDPSGPKCHCTKDFTGDTCEKWDPCLNHKCKNRAKCSQSKTKRSYDCLCAENYYGKYCENVEDPCWSKCSKNYECKLVGDKAECVAMTFKPTTKKKRTSLTTIKRTTMSIVVKQISSTIEPKKTVMEKLQVEKETVRLLQYHPFMNEYTTITIVIIFTIFMVGCFGIAFWILKIKYFQKKNKSYGNYPTLPIMPSVFNTSTYRSEDNFRRWHSLDDNSFYVCGQTPVEPYHTYRSGSNVWPKHDHTLDNFGSLNNSHRMCHSVMRTRMPILCEPSTIDSSDTNFNAANDSQNTSEKTDDFKNNYLVIDNVATSDL